METALLPVLFCFTCEAVKERFELRATPPGEKTVLWTVFSDDRRYLQSIGLNFRICFANNKRKISLPQPNKKNRLHRSSDREFQIKAQGSESGVA